MKKRKFMAVWMAVLVAIACALLLYENDLLWKAQEMNLFLNTSLYFKQQMVAPGGMLTYVGTFFTQFFYYPAVGVLLLCAWWLLLMALTKRAFLVPDRWAVLMLVPVALLLLTIVGMGYWVYFLKLRGHFFVTTIGCTAVVGLLWAFRCLPRRFFISAAFIVAVAAVGYPLMGIYGLAAALLMAVWSWRLDSRGMAGLHTVVAVVVAMAVPLFFYRYVYYETNLTNIYFAELPLFFITERYQQYYVPYYLLLLFFVVMAVVPWTRMPSVDAMVEKSAEPAGPQPSRNEKRRQQKHSKQQKAPKKSLTDSMWFRWGVAHKWEMAVVALVVAGVVGCWYKDDNYHRELSMQHCIDRHDWEGVVRLAAAQEDEPTRAIVMMQNLALARLGRQSTEMYDFKNGSKVSNFPFALRMMQVVGMMIYYQYGKLNDCARLTMEMGVEYDWRIAYYKYLTRCAILDGDKPLAKKYIHILKQTTFYADWAAKAEQLLDHPDQIKNDPEMGPITHMLHYSNVLSSDQGYVEKYVMKHLAESTYTGDNFFQEQCLLASMWMRIPQYFWFHVGNYINLHPNEKLPLYYQQAIYTFAVEQELPHLEQLPIDPTVAAAYDKFARNLAQYDGQDMRVARKALYSLYGNTFFYDFYLMSDLPQY